jgi:flavodoxin
MKVLVAYYSESDNTRKIASAIAGALGAELKPIEDIRPQDVADFDLVFIGTPVQGAKPAPPIARFLEDMPGGRGHSLAAFCTMHIFGARRTLALIKVKAEAKGYRYLGGFSSLGWSRLVANFGPRIFNRGRPDANDLARAANFARLSVGAAPLA